MGEDLGEDLGVDLAFFEEVGCGGELLSESDSDLSARYLLGVWPELLEEVIAMVGPAFSCCVG